MKYHHLSKIRIYLITYFWLSFFPVYIWAQSPVQTIRGHVTDITGSPIVGVTIVVLDQKPLLGTTTDANGQFRLHGVPVGRHTISFSSIGYQTRFVYNQLVTSAREVIIDVTLYESVSELEEIVVRPEISKDEPLNRMALTSARQLSMEEASRYAGGFDDPARLATSFAGVAGNMGDNAIIIRGNAPKGVLWLMEGIEIPPPSHFSEIITIGGGGISALSSQMIANSDFYTGAFPAEYGNALSGVFDLNIRNGNNQRYEHTVLAGIIGLDIGSEGPLHGSGSASYLFNYRLSTFTLVAPLLPEDAANIRYQNLSYKFNLPTQRAGTFSLWGIGATDRSGGDADPSPENWIYNRDREKVNTPTRFGAMGLRNRLLLGNNAYLTTTLAASGTGIDWKLNRYSDDGTTLYPRERVANASWRLTGKSVLNYRFGPGHSNRSGITVTRLGYNQNIRQTENEASPLDTIVDETGHGWLYQTFSQSRFDLERFTFTGGVHVLHFGLTGANSLEPRLGIQYHTGSSSFSLTYGRHSQTEPLFIYFVHPDNLNLGLAKADHLVAGYSRMLTSTFRVNIETYYQWLFNIPVISGSSFSMVNMELDWFIRDRLLNEGNGRNYGIELTLERYLSQGWYGLLTGSVFNSEYRGGDNIWRDTRFNRGYSFALLGGKEWEFRSENRVRLFSVNTRFNFMGGKRISPVNEDLSHILRDIVYDETRAFSRQEPAVFSTDLTLEYRNIRNRITSVWSLQLFNITGYKEFYGYRYNLLENTIEEDREMILLPNLSYKIEF